MLLIRNANAKQCDAMLYYTANIYSHIVIWIYQSYGENVYIDDRQTFLLKLS